MLLLLLGFMALGIGYFVLFRGNTNAVDGEYFYIRSDDSYEKVRENLIYSKVVENVQTFDMVAKQMNLAQSFKAGMYKIEPGLSNIALIRKIRSGQWEKVTIKVKPEMTRDSLVTYLASKLQANAKDISSFLISDWVSANGFTDENVWCIFLPDHYYFNWATNPEKLIERFNDEYKKFWTTENIQKAKSLNLTPAEACVLASIVDGEAIHVDEMSTIAGLYLNRLRKGIKLQADPTVLYAVGREGRHRVLRRDLEADGPYNTYKREGLPPGPIFLPDKRAINAVLNPKKHNYIFMCAKPDNSYRHNFTASSRQHTINANKWRRYLNQQGVRR